LLATGAGKEGEKDLRVEPRKRATETDEKKGRYISPNGKASFRKGCGGIVNAPRKKSRFLRMAAGREKGLKSGKRNMFGGVASAERVMG